MDYKRNTPEANRKRVEQYKKEDVEKKERIAHGK